MSAATDVLLALQADAQLSALLPGGIYGPDTADEITRQATPAAFDAATKELLPCALVRPGVETPAGPYPTSSRAFVDIYFYQRAGTDVIDPARERAFQLLHRVRIGGGWEVLWTDDVLGQRDPALDCSMVLSRYVKHRIR
jgi:hypothetical protein